MKLRIERTGMAYRWYVKDSNKPVYFATNSFGGGVIMYNSDTNQVILQYEDGDGFSVAGLKESSAKAKIKKYMLAHHSKSTELFDTDNFRPTPPTITLHQSYTYEGTDNCLKVG